MQPLVSIIIPTFNRAHLIGETLDSVLAQTYTHWECIVVDDGSTDASEALINKWVQADSRFHFYTRTRLPKGAPPCRNIGLATAQGSYVIFLDSDDYLLSHCLEQRVREFEQHPTHDFLVFPMAIARTGVIRKQDIPVCEDYLIPFLSAKLPWSIVCPIWKTTTLQEANGFDENYLRFNDPELMIRVLLHPDVSYKVYPDAAYDCVIIPSPKGTSQFTDSVFKSLKLLLMDVTKALELAGKADFKFYLAGYLHLWFVFIYTPTKSKNPKQSVLLLVLFYRQDIISFNKMFNLMLRLFIYVSTGLVMKQPINKLTDRILYIS